MLGGHLHRGFVPRKQITYKSPFDLLDKIFAGWVAVPTDASPQLQNEHTLQEATMRVPITTYPFTEEARQRAWDERGIWQAKWVTRAEPLSPPYGLTFRNRFAVPHEQTLRIHVTADERYELYLNGKRIGRGPERGDRHHRFFETYDLPLTPGKHVLVARVWVLARTLLSRR